MYIAPKEPVQVSGVDDATNPGMYVCMYVSLFMCNIFAYTTVQKLNIFIIISFAYVSLLVDGSNETTGIHLPEKRDTNKCIPGSHAYN